MTGRICAGSRLEALGTFPGLGESSVDKMDCLCDETLKFSVRIVWLRTN